MGCRIAQGFYFSKPIPADEFKEFYLNFENNKFKEDREENRSLGRETFS
jgi:sensor c-di-GMP phosphodiesterase-like protein